MGIVEGKVAIVTGGTRGIGFTIVREFLKNGAKVALAGSRQETVDAALAKLAEEGFTDNVMGIAPALTDPDSVAAAFASVVDRFGRLDVLCNNAGVSSRTPLVDYTLEEFNKVMSINVTAVFVCTQAAARIMIEQGEGGAIVNTSSMVGKYGQPSGFAYPTSKFAVNGLTLSLARELAKHKIRVNAVAPGVTLLPGTILRGHTAVDRDSEIGPNSMLRDCRIGQRTTVNASQLNDSTVGSDTTVGPFTYVRPGCTIGDHCRVGDFVEVKNSVIGDGTKISHLTYVGDSDVGKNVNFGCGTVTVNFDGHAKYRTVIGDDCFIGCNSTLIAPVEIGAGSYVAAGSTITDPVPDDALAFGVLSSALAENFIGASQPMRIILSVPGARKYSLIQWLEFPTLDAEEPEPRTVYIMDSAPIGRTLGVGLVHTCLPLPALGEVPAAAPEEEGPLQPGSPQDDIVGVL